MKRTSALQLCFSPRICIPSAPLVVKLTCDVRSGTSLFVNSVPPSISKYGFTFFGCDNIHLNANGFTPPPSAVFVFCVSTHAGTTSNAYSNCPFKNPGPRGLVKINPYRNPRFHTPVSDVLPLSPCPPPVHICNSRLEFSGDPCAREFEPGIADMDGRRAWAQWEHVGYGRMESGVAVWIDFDEPARAGIFEGAVGVRV